mgnify:CR=1 FL=1
MSRQVDLKKPTPEDIAWLEVNGRSEELQIARDYAATAAKIAKAKAKAEAAAAEAEAEPEAEAK